MARFGQQFIAGLLQPSYQEGLFTAAQQLGAAPGIRREAKLENTRERGRGDLKAMAVQKGFNEQDPKMLNAYLSMADKFNVSRSEAMDILSTARNLTPTAGGVTYIDGGHFVDKRGLKYNLQIERDKANRVVNQKYVPIGHQNPYVYEYDGGKKNSLTQTGGAYGLTGSEAAAREVDIEAGTEEAKDFIDFRNEAREQVSGLQSEIANLNRAATLFESMENTGGFDVAIAQRIASLFGTTGETEAEITTRLQEVVLNKLSVFTGAISEGERQYLVDQVGGLDISKPGALAKLNVFLEQAQRAYANAIIAASSSNYDDYLAKTGVVLATDKRFDDLGFTEEEKRQAAIEISLGQYTMQQLLDAKE